MDNEVFILLMLVGVFAGFVDSAVGGGGLLRLPAVLWAGLPPHVALGTNKFASTAAAAVASIKYLESGIVPRKAARIGFILMIIFSMIGTYAVLLVEPDVLLPIVIVVLIALFFYVLFNPKFGKEEDLKEERVIPVTVGMGTGIGFYEGFLGPGTGSMLMAGYIKGAGFGMDRAAATARILNFGGNIGSYAIFAIVSIPSSVNSKSTFSVFSKALYCLIKLLSGSFKIRLKSSLFNASSSTLIGNLP